MWIRHPSHLISQILAPALKLWIRSQVDAIEELHFQLQGQDRQILRGYIPSVVLSGCGAVYQGLHLGKVCLEGDNIRINIGQILKGKPVKLLEPLILSGEVSLSENDLCASIPSSLLAGGLTDVLSLLLDLNGVSNATEWLASHRINWQEIRLYRHQLRLVGQLLDRYDNATVFEISAGLELFNPHTLLLKSIYLEGLSVIKQQSVQEYALDLGSAVEIEALTLETGQLFCQGRFIVYP